MRSEVWGPRNLRPFTLVEVVGLWLAITLPMGFFVFGVAPFFVDRLPYDAGLIFWACVIAGMVVQFLVAIAVLVGEGQVWTWAQLRRRLWLTMPRHPKTKRAVPWALIAWPVLGAVLCALISEAFFPILDVPFASRLPAWMVPDYGVISVLATHENKGAWHLLAFAFLSSVFNYGLGEALFFHCVLLPRMVATFGRWAWLVNGALLGLYHVHKLSFMPTVILSSLPFAFPAQRYRSSLLAILMHGVEGIFLLLAILLVITGTGG